MMGLADGRKSFKIDSVV